MSQTAEEKVQALREKRDKLLKDLQDPTLDIDVATRYVSKIGRDFQIDSLTIRLEELEEQVKKLSAKAK